MPPTRCVAERRSTLSFRHLRRLLPTADALLPGGTRSPCRFSRASLRGGGLCVLLRLCRGQAAVGGSASAAGAAQELRGHAHKGAGESA